MADKAYAFQPIYDVKANGLTYLCGTYSSLQLFNIAKIAKKVEKHFLDDLSRSIPMEIVEEDPKTPLGQDEPVEPPKLVRPGCIPRDEIREFKRLKKAKTEPFLETMTDVYAQMDGDKVVTEEQV